MRATDSIVSAVFIALATGCAAYIKHGRSTASLDGAMTFSVVDVIGPGENVREHKLFFGVGDKNENPAVKYLKGQRVYRLEKDLDWEVVWLSSDRVKLTTYECPGYKGLREHPDPGCRQLDSVEFFRGGASALFHELPNGTRS